MYQKGRSHHPSTRKIEGVMLRELFTPDVERIESIRSVIMDEIRSTIPRFLNRMNDTIPRIFQLQNYTIPRNLQNS